MEDSMQLEIIEREEIDENYFIVGDKERRDIELEYRVVINNDVIEEDNERGDKMDLIRDCVCTLDEVDAYYKMQEYRRHYYQENYKYKQYFCGVCRCVMRQGSKSNHNKSFKHMSAVRHLYDNK
jgi:hypothetical protein